MHQKQKKDYKKLISLRLLACDGPYSISYLYRLIREKKLHAVKIDGNYYSSQEWLFDYLEKQIRHDPASLEKEVKSFVYRIERQESLMEKVLRDIDEADEQEKDSHENYNDIEDVFIRGWLKAIEQEVMEATAGAKSTIKEKYSLWLKKIKRNYKLAAATGLLRFRIKKTAGRLYPWPRAATLVTLGMISLVAAVAISRFTPTTATRITSIGDKVFLAPFKATGNIADSFVQRKFTREDKGRIKADRGLLSSFINNYSWRYQVNDPKSESTYVIEAEEILGQVAGAEERPETLLGD